MKLSLFLFVLSLFQLQANNSYGQRTKITVYLNNVTYGKIFETIEEQTEFNFFYNIDDVDTSRKTSLKVTKEKIFVILDQLFQNSDVEYKVNGKQIILVPKSGPSTPLTNKKLDQFEVQGVVTGPKGLPLPGATVAIKGENRGTTTNIDGKYTINASANDILIFSYIGFKTVEESVNRRSEINVVLVEDISALQEVEINAGYYNTTAREVTGNISRITAEAIEKQPVTNPLAAMQGRMPGVHITQTSGVPGSGFEIRIRGRNSIRPGGNEPLFIIDGVPFPSNTLGNYILSGAILPGYGASPLNNIDPSNIESIEVLKDADATAIYGSRGANGVVLITTKKGKIGKTEFDLNISSGFGETTRTMHLLNTVQYLEVRREAFANDGISEYPANAYDVNGTWDRDRYTDWQEELIGGTADLTNIQASASGGSLNTRFFVSGGYHRETTVFPGDSEYNKASVYSSLSHTSEDNKLSANLSASYVANKNNLLSTDLTREARILPPNAPPLYDEEGNLNWANSTWSNPLRLLKGNYLAKNKTLIANAVINYSLLPNVELKANLGFVDMDMVETNTSPSTIYNPAFGLGSEASIILLNNSGQQSWIIEPQINWRKTIGKGQLNILAGATFQEEIRNQQTLYGSGFSSNSLINNISAASNLSVINSSSTTYRYTAIFGRINYDLLGKYFFNLTGRRDGSSRFGPGKRFANFGAIGAAWIFFEEEFINKNFPVLSFGKLRGSYGTTGSDQIGDYQFLDTYSLSGNIYQGIIGLQPTRLFNPDFSWETNKKMEIALELGFVKDHIFLGASYYRNRSSNQLVGIPLPGTTGFASIQANLGATVENTGLEIELRTINFQKESFNWTTSFNITVPRNELIEFPGLENSTYANTYEVGEPLNIRKVYSYTGIDPQTGIYQFVDFNGDDMISTLDDRQKIVQINPNYFGGLNNSLSYKNWQLDFFFQFVQQKGLNYLFVGSQPGTKTNQPVEVLDRWQQPGNEALVQRYTTGFNSQATMAYSLLGDSDAAISDASFIRMKNVAFSYQLPQAWAETFTGKFYVQGQNLFTITDYRGPDPENQSLRSLPPLRIFTFGVQLTF